MRKKRLRLLTVFVTGLASAFSLSLQANATTIAESNTSDTGKQPQIASRASQPEEIDISSANVLPVTIGFCTGHCAGHIITGTYTPTDDSIQEIVKVTAGTHDITLKDVKIDATTTKSVRPISIEGSKESATTVNLTLENSAMDTNTLHGGGSVAGLFVSPYATLNIKGTGSLDAKGGYGAAGIGGDGQNGSCGAIEIDCTGTIKAVGGDTAAGIGGGVQGPAGKITIKNGTIIAQGGNGVSSSVGGTVSIRGGSGIGSGGSCKERSGEIVISGGKVTALGGYNQDNTPSQSYGINGTMLNSAGSSVTLVTNSISGDTSFFNGIVWDESETIGKVYGNAVLTDPIKEHTSIEIPSGFSLSVPLLESGNRLLSAGVIWGSGTLIDAPNLYPMPGHMVQVEDMSVSMTKDDITLKTPLSYTGADLLKTESPITIRPTRKVGDTTYRVDQTDWVREIQKGGEIFTEIVDKGDYSITYKKPNYSSIPVGILEVQPRNFSDVTITPVKDQIYTGKPITPEFTVSYNNQTLKEWSDDEAKGDYTVEYENNTEFGQATIKVSAMLGSNYTGEKSINFNIVAASLDEDANVSVIPPTALPVIYNGTEQKPTIEVTVPENDPDVPTVKTLQEGRDFEVAYSPEDFVNANEIEITITGIGNYGGEVKQTYTIEKKGLTLTKVTPESRQYNGTDKVDISGAEFAGLVKGDKPADVILKSQGTLEKPETVANVGDVGEYNTITFAEYKLEGSKANNYFVEAPVEGSLITTSDILANPIVISKADSPEKPELTGKPDKSSEYAGKFNCTLEIANAQEGIEYQYRMKKEADEEFGEWQLSNVFDDLEPLETYIFEAQFLGTYNVEASEASSIEITFNKLEESRIPEGYTLEFALNKDGETYTGTILPMSEDVEYFIGTVDDRPGDEDYSSAESGRNPNMKTDCEAATDYIGYVRFKETATHNASEPFKITGFTETLVVKEPTISLLRDDSSGGNGSEDDANNEGNEGNTDNEGSNEESKARETSADDITLGENEFLETGKVKITCKTKGATIYYTTDGTDPTDQDNEYTGPFEINGKGETTIKAFAIKDGREDSPTASATFTRRLLNVETPIITPEDGESFTGSILVTIECPTEGADIYYTTDGSEPDVTNKKQKYKEPFRINTSSTINAIAVMKDMDPSEMATASLEKLESTVNVYSSLATFATTGEDTQNNPISDELMDKLGTKDKKVASESIVAQLTAELSVIGSNGDFTYDRMRFYDLVLKVKVDSEPLRDATADDFSEGGLTVTVPYPEGTSLEANDFAIAHMFGSGENTGKIETWQNITVTKTPSGLQFTVTSASPLAIAWTTAVPNGPNSNNVSGGDNVVDPDGPNGDNNGDNQGDNNGDNQGDNNGDNQGDVTVTANPRDGGTGDGTTAGGNSSTTGTGNGTVSDAVRSAVSSVLPKTGDTSKLLVWVVLAVACVAVIVGVQLKAKKGNKKKK